MAPEPHERTALAAGASEAMATEARDVPIVHADTARVSRLVGATAAATLAAGVMLAVVVRATSSSSLQTEGVIALHGLDIHYKRGIGCRSWADILVNASLENTLTACAMRCIDTPACSAMNFQELSSEQCSGGAASGSHIGECYLYSGECDAKDEEANDCWTIGSVSRTASLPAFKEGVACTNVAMSVSVEETRMACYERCASTSWCVAMTFQGLPDKLCTEAGTGVRESACYLFNDPCDEVESACWSLQSVPIAVVYGHKEPEGKPMRVAGEPVVSGESLGWCSHIREEQDNAKVDRPGICPERWEAHIGGGTSSDDFPRVDPELERQQFERLRKYLDDHSSDERHWYYQEGFEALQSLSKFEAKDILAFSETWTDLDTQLLKRLDGSGFASGGKLTTEAFRARLPSVKDLARLVDLDMAMVGGGGGLTDAGHGHRIDEYSVVVRFNTIVDDNLVPDETGTRTSVHVMNCLVPPSEQEGVLEMDLEFYWPWRSYCSRWHSDGEFAAATHKQIFIRPSAYCAMQGIQAFLWTRGFLFYWFIGRMFKTTDLYGFSGKEHYHNDVPLYEHFLEFEHFFYEFEGLNRNQA